MDHLVQQRSGHLEQQIRAIASPRAPTPTWAATAVEPVQQTTRTDKRTMFGLQTRGCTDPYTTEKSFL